MESVQCPVGVIIEGDASSNSVDGKRTSSHDLPWGTGQVTGTTPPYPPFRTGGSAMVAMMSGGGYTYGG